MMKKLKMMLMALLLTVVAVGCSNGDKTSDNGSTAGNETVSPETIMTKIQEKISSEYDMPLENGKLPGFDMRDITNAENLGIYADHFNVADIEEGYILEPMMNVKSSLIFVIKAKNEAAVTKVKEGLEKVKSDQEATWSTYLPDQYELVKANQIKVQGNYLLYVTSDIADDIVKIFEEQVK